MIPDTTRPRVESVIPESPIYPFGQRFSSHWKHTNQWSQPVRKLMTEDFRVVARRRNNNPRSVTVRISAMMRNKKKNTAGIRRLDDVQIPAKNGKKIQDVVQMTSNNTTEEIFEKP